mmetsp:Transcript_12747/g.39103  ORF Transcript_12747/g.39103 Transcript_12747/m.39103 type:complete len:349 (+) Transcript_12747:178-1224(+)
MAALSELTEEKRSQLAALTALSVLQRQDEAVSRILCSASHVIVYKLEQDVNKGTPGWKHMDIQGVLHVIERRTEPRFRLLVMNRKGIENLKDDLIPGQFELEFSSKLLMYKNCHGKIRGIWFYDDKDLAKAQNIISDIADGRVVPSDQPPAEDNFLHPSEQAPNSTYQHQDSAQDPAIVSNGNNIEKLFPNLNLGDQGMQRTAASAPAEQYQAGQQGFMYPPDQNTGASPQFKDAEAIFGPVMGAANPSNDDGNTFLNMLRGGGETSAAQPPPAPYEGYQDSAIIAQAGPPVKQELIIGEQGEEVLKFLERGGLRSQSSPLRRDELRAVLARLLHDDAYFEAFYSAYV